METIKHTHEEELRDAKIKINILNNKLEVLEERRNELEKLVTTLTQENENLKTT